MNRRDFLKFSATGIATLVVGSKMPWFMGSAEAAFHTTSLAFDITDAMKQMVTYNQTNTSATCYFWIYKSTTPNLRTECPGPQIFTTKGDLIPISITNKLDEPHSFFIPGVFNSGPIAPNATFTGTIDTTNAAAGTYLYYDNLNAPVNRVMGLHGAFVIMPKTKAVGHKWTPYDAPTPAVQQLYDDFGTAAHWPGLPWQQGDPTTNTLGFRQYIWLCSEASPKLFTEVGNFTPGLDYPSATFTQKYLNSTFRADGLNFKANFFTINGQSGHFSHNNPYICPHNRVGEPVIIRILGAGLWTHSLHIHANHVFVTSVNRVVQANPLWVDTFTLHPLDTFEYTVPYMRPPDIPNVRGIGRPDTPLTTATGTTWPPFEELNTFIPPVGTLANPLNPASIDISCQQSPLCYPMHSHSEASQTAQGGNYNCGMICGINFIGDRNTPDPVAGTPTTTFPNPPTIKSPNVTGPPSKPF
jgi:FtsP/CotA-like multicopper oxidase with cupredoxin domain